MIGACGRIRTSDRLVRSQVLYPAELRTRKNGGTNNTSKCTLYTQTTNAHVEKLARAEGFEPPTAWFVARYSIQLSYARAIF
jgi:hypothetical protein